MKERIKAMIVELQVERAKVHAINPIAAEVRLLTNAITHLNETLDNLAYCKIK